MSNPVNPTPTPEQLARQKQEQELREKMIRESSKIKTADAESDVQAVAVSKPVSKPSDEVVEEGSIKGFFHFITGGIFRKKS